MAWFRIIVAVACRPRLWATAVRQMWRTAAPGWYRRAPFLPVPAGEYLRFRLVTQYGDAHHRPEVADVVNYLAWCRQWNSDTP
ncbi:unannotated protein [freshwater metagenome]|uniref:Unannotated protein n=1 Tax=freshwater metagenome TaxID=449393 RepID=A0A6J7EET2_9ZZZZ|nr:hypothetical protein [Actinomycetota bacterium]